MLRAGFSSRPHWVVPGPDPEHLVSVVQETQPAFLHQHVTDPDWFYFGHHEVHLWLTNKTLLQFGARSVGDCCSR